ncbi:conserved hypothetical protein [delta proteobacterium NaphS2]|nr:conserved hypothetical protein [delta proteobacterium NaphS2]
MPPVLNIISHISLFRSSQINHFPEVHMAHPIKTVLSAPGKA